MLRRISLLVSIVAACSSSGEGPMDAAADVTSADVQGDAAGDGGLLDVVSETGVPSAHGMFMLNPPGTGSPAFFNNHLAPTFLSDAGAGAPYVKGATFYIAWKDVEASEGTFDFDGVVGPLKTPWTNAGKLVGLVFMPTQQAPQSTITPSWYETPIALASVARSGGIITIQTSGPIGFFSGGLAAAPGLEVQITGTGSLDGIWTVCDHTHAGCSDPASQKLYAVSAGPDVSAVTNAGMIGNPIYDATNNCGSSTLPIPWRTNFIHAWQSFIQHAIAKYGADPSIAYMRFGLGLGGENIPNALAKDPACQAEMTDAGFTTLPAPWPAPTSAQWSQVTSVWTTFLDTMFQFEQAQGSQRLIGTTLSPIETVGTDFLTPDTTAADAVKRGIGIGNQGLQRSDPINYDAGKPCVGGDWCANFIKYRGQVPLELQQIGASEPGDDGGNGSLVPLLPFATSLGAEILEIYPDDWLCTFDTTWVGQTGIGTNTFAGCSAAGYPAAFKAAAAAIN